MNCASVSQRLRSQIKEVRAYISHLKPRVLEIAESCLQLALL